MAIIEINGGNAKATTRFLHRALIDRWVEDASWKRLTGQAGVYNTRIASVIGDYVKRRWAERRNLPTGCHEIPEPSAWEPGRLRTVIFPPKPEAEYRLNALDRIRHYRKKRFPYEQVCEQDLIAFFHAGFLGTDGRINPLIEPQAFHLVDWLEAGLANPQIEASLFRAGRIYDLNMSGSAEANWIRQEGKAFAALADNYPQGVAGRLIAERMQVLDRHLARWERQPPAALPGWRFRQYCLKAPSGHSIMLILIEDDRRFTVFRVCRTDEEFLACLRSRKLLMV